MKLMEAKTWLLTVLAILLGTPLFAQDIATGALGQTKPAFEVASVKPSAPLDMAKLAAGI
jgi:hypothetical protein